MEAKDWDRLRSGDGGRAGYQHEPDAAAAVRQGTGVAGVCCHASHNALCEQVTNVGQRRWPATPPLPELIGCSGMSGYGSWAGLSCLPGFSVDAAARAEISRAEDFVFWQMPEELEQLREEK